MRPRETLVEEYEWIHTWVGVVGNVLFFTGSILFLQESTKSMGTWLFIVGTGMMLIANVGSALVQKTRARREFGASATARSEARSTS